MQAKYPSLTALSGEQRAAFVASSQAGGEQDDHDVLQWMLF